MTPITENRSGTVRVFDADGQELTATYPRRAKGLLKNGRAQRCVTADGEEAILLSADSAPVPPPDKSEEYKMAEVLENKIPELEEMPEAIAENAETAPELPEIKSAALVMEYAQELRELLDQLMDMIREENDPDSKKAVIAEYAITLEKYDQLVNPPTPQPYNVNDEMKKRMVQTYESLLEKLKSDYDEGRIDLKQYLSVLYDIERSHR